MTPTFCRLTACASVAATALFVSGCGPQFATVKGTINSDGGALRAWSANPAICSRGDDAQQVVKFEFGLPPGFQASKPGNKNAPQELLITHNGAGYMGSLKMMSVVNAPGVTAMSSVMDGFTLDNSICKTVQLDTKEQSAGFATNGKLIKGHLVLDCTVQGSHVTADMNFKNCSI